MADIADLAQEDMEREAAAVFSARKPAGPVPDGHCHYCDEPVLDGMPFCDADCRDAWDNEQRQRRNLGRD